MSSTTLPTTGTPGRPALPDGSSGLLINGAADLRQ
jgi:hypothetical protein